MSSSPLVDWVAHLSTFMRTCERGRILPRLWQSNERTTPRSRDRASERMNECACECQVKCRNGIITQKSWTLFRTRNNANQPATASARWGEKERGGSEAARQRDLCPDRGSCHRAGVVKFTQWDGRGQRMGAKEP